MILDRIKEIKGWKGHGSDRQLHEFLGVSKQVLSGWRARSSLDWEKVKSKLTGRDFAYVTTGNRLAADTSEGDEIRVIREAPAVEDSQPDYETLHGTPPIRPSMVAMAAQMVDEVIESMPPALQPKGAPKWEAIARVARLLALDRIEGTEGTARNFLLGMRQEWQAAKTKTGA